MESDPASTRASRLRQLQGYLAQDPANPHLLAQVCDAALAAGDHTAALQAVEAAEGLGLERAPWLHRRAHVAMARGDWNAALAALARLREDFADDAALVHDVAMVHFLAGDHAACRETLEPWLARPAVADEMLASLQVLWLRAMHHLGPLAEAWAWVQQMQMQHRLQRRAMGVAALIAIDLERFQPASDLADEALREPAPVAEALVAAAYVALARRQPERAAGLLQRALALNPRDGRTWSARGMASLQAGDVAAARRHLEQAVTTLSNHIGTWHALGWSCLLQKDLPAAHNAFARALALDRNFGESHAALALLLLLEGNETEVEHHLRVAERLDSRSVTAGYVRALRGGELRDAGAVRALAQRLLDRPGFFGGRLSDSLSAADE